MNAITRSILLPAVTALLSTRRLTTLACVALAAPGHPATAATGDLDLSFGVGGKVTTAISGADTAYCMAVQSDGKIVVAVSAYIPSGTFNDTLIALARYNPDGSLDASFGNGTGKVTIPPFYHYELAYAVAIQSDGKIVVAGTSSNGGGTDYLLVRFHANGSLDTGIGNGTGRVRTFFQSGQSFSAQSVALQSDGKIVVAGVGGLVRYTSSCILDTSFSGDGVAMDGPPGYGVAVQSDGKIVVAGSSVQGGGTYNYDFAISRFNTNGSPDTSFGNVTTDFGSGSDVGYSVALQGDGKIVIAGYAAVGSAYEFALVRYTTDGDLDTSFNGTGKVTTDIGTGNSFARSVAIQADGKIVVAGSSSNPFSAVFALVRYNSDGSLDTSFNGTGKATVDFGTENQSANGVAVQSDGRIIVAGFSSSAQYQSVFALARFEGAQPGISGSQTVNLGSPVTLTAIPARPNPLTYQWSKDGVDIPGATGSSFTIPNAQPWHIGDYKVVVTDSYGVTTSDAALVQIADVPTAIWRGLLAYYPFDGNALDREAGAAHATVSGAVLTSDRLGQPNRAFDFDGIDDQMTAVIPNLPVGNAPRTLSLWAKERPDPSRNVSLAQWGVGQNGRAFGLVNANAPYTWTGETFGTGPRVNSGVTVDSKWHHLCLTYDGSTLTIYLDGVLRQTQPGAIDTVLSALWLGLGVTGSDFYPGSLDEVRIYNRALSPSEVQQLKASEDPDSDGDAILDRFETGTGIYVSPEDTGTSRTNSDTDGDGLSDGREVFTYLSNPTVLDTDGDGFDDGFEVSTGFSPTSAASTPDTLSTALPAIEYRFNAAAGVSYRIEASTDLAIWSTIETNIVGTGGVVTRFYSIEGQERRFFRSRRN